MELGQNCVFRGHANDSDARFSFNQVERGWDGLDIVQHHQTLRKVCASWRADA
jgi:hypothetical protein